VALSRFQVEGHWQATPKLSWVTVAHAAASARACLSATGKARGHGAQAKRALESPALSAGWLFSCAGIIGECETLTPAEFELADIHASTGSVRSAGPVNFNSLRNPSRWSGPLLGPSTLSALLGLGREASWKSLRHE
jgi:hypothetical protein